MAPLERVTYCRYVVGPRPSVRDRSAGDSSPVTPRAVGSGDAIPIRIGESSQFTNGGSAPLELFVMGVARDMAAKTQLLTGAPR